MKLATARVAIFLLALMLCVMVVQPSASTQKMSAMDHIRRGVDLHDKGDLDGAIAEYRAAIQLKPGFSKAHFNLGVALYGKGELDAAIVEFRAAIHLEPKFADAHTSLADSLSDKGDMEAAIAECHIAIELAPKNPRAWNSLAWLHATSQNPRFRDPSKALEYAVKAVSLSKAKDAASLDTLAEAYFVNGDYDKAIETEKKALAISLGNASIEERLEKQLDKYQKAKQTKK